MGRYFTSAQMLLVAAAFGLLGVALQYASPWPVGDRAVSFLYGIAAGCAFAALLRRFMPEPCDAAPKALQRRYLHELLPAMAAYLLALFASVWLLKRVDEPALRACIALLPVPPIAMAMRAIVRYIRDVDEMQQRIELEAVSIATALVSLLYLAGGFLQSAKVIDIPATEAMIWVFPLVCLVYGLAKLFVLRRFQ